VKNSQTSGLTKTKHHLSSRPGRKAHENRRPSGQDVHPLAARGKRGDQAANTRRGDQGAPCESTRPFCRWRADPAALQEKKSRDPAIASPRIAAGPPAGKISWPQSVDAGEHACWEERRITYAEQARPWWIPAGSRQGAIDEAYAGSVRVRRKAIRAHEGRDREWAGDFPRRQESLRQAQAHSRARASVKSFSVRKIQHPRKERKKIRWRRPHCVQQQSHGLGRTTGGRGTHRPPPGD